MTLFLIILGLMVLSVLLAVHSLRDYMKSHKEVSHVKKELQKGRVIFHSDSSSSESS